MAADTAERMDRMYRHQRHIYNLTRKFYLLGRDRLIATLEAPRRARICEIGCGTGRNLLALARRHPEAEIYGIDASQEMLKSARASIARAGLDQRIRIRCALAEQLDLERAFGLAGKFDVVVFSYTLSMIPSWERALDHAATLIEPSGVLAVVDFSEQRRLPAWFRALLRRWLALFDVTPRAGLLAYLREIATREGGAVTVESLYCDYACLMRYYGPAASRSV
jgi:S-adenosylmethionine-diacylgycerolhomoserine-N-methlytransferase